MLSLHLTLLLGITRRRVILKASYGNDSVALIQWAYERGLRNVCVLYNDTGWSAKFWPERVEELEKWARGLGFETARTQSIGMERLVRGKKGWPRQGIQFCTAELKMKPTEQWLAESDPQRVSIAMIGVRRAESVNRRTFPEHSIGQDGRRVWAPLVRHTDEERDCLLSRAGIAPLPHRSMECFPCINSNRADLRMLARDPERIRMIAEIENDLGYTSKGQPRTMFRPYRYQGATGIKEIVRWGMSDRGKFDLDDGNGSSGCEAGWCGL